MNPKIRQLYNNIKQALVADEIVLPSLPEVALNIRHEIEQNDCSVKKIASLLEQDGALAAHFIRIANSPMYRGVEKISDLQTIITRMGLKIVRDLVVSLAIKQIFTPTSDALDKEFRNAWHTSSGVAAISHSLAKTIKGLSPEQAFLAGLIHNIGTLPILMMAEKEHTTFETDAELEQLIAALQPHIGRMVLETWEFPDYFIDVVTECHKFDRVHDDSADYTDIVQVSLLQGDFLNDTQKELINQPVAAYEKLNLDPEGNFIELEENQQAINEAQALFAS